MSKVLAFGCTHLPVHSEQFRQWRLEKIREFKPDVVVNLGDWLDADAASRWPNEHEWTLKDEYRLLAQDANDIREAAGPDAKLVWLLGNHDDNLRAPNRIPKKLREVCSWEQDLDVHEAIRSWRVVPYGHRQHFRIGQLTFLHGAQTNINSDRDQALLYGVQHGLTVSAHTHRPVDITRVVLPGKIPLEYYFANVGCGADWDKMEYVQRTNIATWGRAILLAEVNDKQRRSSFASKQWTAELIVHSRAH